MKGGKFVGTGYTVMAGIYSNFTPDTPTTGLIARQGRVADATLAEAFSFIAPARPFYVVWSDGNLNREQAEGRGLLGTLPTRSGAAALVPPSGTAARARALARPRARPLARRA